VAVFEQRVVQEDLGACRCEDEDVGEVAVVFVGLGGVDDDRLGRAWLGFSVISVTSCKSDGFLPEETEATEERNHG
jgi:hypothetical protein